MAHIESNYSLLNEKSKKQQYFFSRNCNFTFCLFQNHIQFHQFIISITKQAKVFRSLRTSITSLGIVNLELINCKISHITN